MISTVVTAFPRIHIGLLDLGNATFRKYGGAGIMLDWPVNTVTARRSSTNEILGLDPLDASAQRDVHAVMSHLAKKYALEPLRLEISHSARQHVGLGSKTALIMASITAATRAQNLTLAPEELQRISARGGVSGIGLHGFFQGGLLIDAGHPQDHLNHVPSSSVSVRDPPLLMLRTAIDVQWTFFLVLPKGRMYSDGAEVELFRDNTPTKANESFAALALLYHGVAPAFMTNNLPSLRSALREFRQNGFKLKEIEAQDKTTRATLDALETLDGCAVGMSSVGPLLYAATNMPAGQIEPAIRAVCAQVGAEILAICRARNAGYSIQQIEI